MNFSALKHFSALQIVKKVRYRPSDSLGPQATAEQVESIIEALRCGRVQIGGKALRYLTGVWRMTPDRFLDSIRSHLHEGCRLFRKFARDGSGLLPNIVEGSIWIREPDDEDDYDDGTIYVELIIRGNQVVLIFDAHEHEEGILRLPQ